MKALQMHDIKPEYQQHFINHSKEAFLYVKSILKRSIEDVKTFLSQDDKYDISGWKIDY